MDYSSCFPFFNREPPRRYGLIPEKKNEDSGFMKMFGKSEKEATEDYVCPFKYCDTDLVNGRKITGVRQSGSIQEKTFIDILHENAVRQMCGTLPEDLNAQYERPYIGKYIKNYEKRKKFEQAIQKKAVKEKKEAEQAFAKKILFNELPF